jgi:hypothetical protein
MRMVNCAVTTLAKGAIVETAVITITETLPVAS